MSGGMDMDSHFHGNDMQVDVIPAQAGIQEKWFPFDRDQNFSFIYHPAVRHFQSDKFYN